jgi:hypothetical protein
MRTRRATGIGVAVGAVAVSLAACGPLTVTRDEPSTRCTGFTAVTKQQSIDKVDLLLMIDNSPGMADKQAYFAAAIRDIVSRLAQPHCVDAADPTRVIGSSDATGACPAGQRIEFPPVHDLHIGVVTSSLGARGGDICNPSTKTGAGLDAHDDDRGRLVARGGDDEHAIADMQPSNFLAWFPGVAANVGRDAGHGAVPQTDLAAYRAELSDLLSGVHDHGCLIESQLESWYRFLVQPDPYDAIDPNSPAMWVGIDHTILQQRRDFLRPDSLVAIIALSDENDSEIDVRALVKQAYLWNRSDFKPPRGTSACLTDPNSPTCTSCKLALNGGAGDPECAKGDYAAANDWGFDMNLRHAQMKRKYGVDLQFPIARYVAGLTSPSVPNRDGEYPAGKGNYVGDARCVNPLFAAQLPGGGEQDPAKLCNLRRGPRTKDLIFFAHIGGVPSRLLHYKPNDPAGSTLSDDDWTAILGRDPEHHDYTGIDAHMIESYAPRAGLPSPASADNADPDHGREWITNASAGVDLEYACTFPLAKARDCADPTNREACDCPAIVGAPHDTVPPLCDAADVTKQVRAKAYPTTRELLLARKMGAQGIVASICPIHSVEQMPSDPLYGYRPGVGFLVDRLRDALDSQCMPEALPVGEGGNVPCLVLEVLPSREMKCEASLGLVDPDPATVRRFRDELRAQGGGDGGVDDPSTHTICELAQIAPADFVDGGCAASSKPGWCYVTGPAAGACPQTILFSPAGLPQNGVVVSLQCSKGC